MASSQHEDFESRVRFLIAESDIVKKLERELAEMKKEMAELKERFGEDTSTTSPALSPSLPPASSVSLTVPRGKSRNPNFVFFGASASASAFEPPALSRSSSISHSPTTPLTHADGLDSFFPVGGSIVADKNERVLLFRKFLRQIFEECGGHVWMECDFVQRMRDRRSQRPTASSSLTLPALPTAMESLRLYMEREGKRVEFVQRWALRAYRSIFGSVEDASYTDSQGRRIYSPDEMSATREAIKHVWKNIQRMVLRAVESESTDGENGGGSGGVEMTKKRKRGAELGIPDPIGQERIYHLHNWTELDAVESRLYLQARSKQRAETSTVSPEHPHPPAHENVETGASTGNMSSMGEGNGSTTDSGVETTQRLQQIQEMSQMSRTLGFSEWSVHRTSEALKVYLRSIADLRLRSEVWLRGDIVWHYRCPRAAFLAAAAYHGYHDPFSSLPRRLCHTLSHVALAELRLGDPRLMRIIAAYVHGVELERREGSNLVEGVWGVVSEEERERIKQTARLVHENPAILEPVAVPLGLCLFGVISKRMHLSLSLPSAFADLLELPYIVDEETATIAPGSGEGSSSRPIVDTIAVTGASGSEHVAASGSERTSHALSDRERGGRRLREWVWDVDEMEKECEEVLKTWLEALNVFYDTLPAPFQHVSLSLFKSAVLASYLSPTERLCALMMVIANFAMMGDDPEKGTLVSSLTEIGLSLLPLFLDIPETQGKNRLTNGGKTIRFDCRTYYRKQAPIPTDLIDF